MTVVIKGWLKGGEEGGNKREGKGGRTWVYKRGQIRERGVGGW